MRTKKITNQAAIGINTFSAKSNAVRVGRAGIALLPIGPLGAAIRVGPGNTLEVYNSTASVVFVSFGIQTMSAPVGPADGIPVLPNSYRELNSGDSQWVRASSSSAFGYIDADTQDE